MQWTPQLTALRDILAELFPTIQESQQVIQEAGHLVHRFASDSKAITNWHNILSEALKHDGMVDELVTVAIVRYDRNRALAEAYAAYQKLSGTEPNDNTGNVSQPPYAQPARPAINTGGGAYIAGNVTVQGNFTGRDQLSGDRDHTEQSPAADRKIKVLFLAANPVDTPILKLDEEVRAIDQALIQAQYRDYFAFEKHFAVQYGDLQQLLLRHQPDIVHFSGHGSKTGELLLQGANDQSHPIGERSLSRLFSVLKDNIRCVVLNACYSEGQATAIAQHIDTVIGMKNELGDDAARNFAAAFYQGLGYGRSVQTAFELGCLQIDLANIVEADEPQLKALRVDAAQLFFVSK